MKRFERRRTHSTVEFEDLATSEMEEYTITFPDRANVDPKRLSILAPIGTALIGCRVGDIVKWSTPVRTSGTRRIFAILAAKTVREWW